MFSTVWCTISISWTVFSSKVIIIIVYKMFLIKLQKLPVICRSVLGVSSVEHALRMVYSIVLVVMILFLAMIAKIKLLCRIEILYSCSSLPRAEIEVCMSFVILLCQLSYIIV